MYSNKLIPHHAQTALISKGVKTYQNYLKKKEVNSSIKQKAIMNGLSNRRKISRGHDKKNTIEQRYKLIKSNNGIQQEIGIRRNGNK